MPAFHQALSPFTPLIDQQKGGYYNQYDNFACSAGKTTSKLLNHHHHHHGYSEYNRRVAANDRDSYQNSGGTGGGNQESAFNFRKQTLCEDENSSDDDVDVHSCTEVDLMTNMRGCDINYFSSQSNNNGGAVGQGTATPNKFLN